MTSCCRFPRVISIRNATDLEKLEHRLGFQFADISLLDQALTHKSYARSNNERLEFLGDAVLGYVIAHALFETHPDLAEDSLTLMRASLVRKDTLHDVATELGIGDFLRLGLGERKSGGRDRASILADALEAVIGAIRVDGGIEPARRVILQLFSQRIRKAAEDDAKDPKTRLQELLQGRKLDLPRYEVIETTGSEHRREFVVSCTVDALQLTTQGVGHSRRIAEKVAAEIMLIRIQDAD